MRFNAGQGSAVDDGSTSVLERSAQDAATHLTSPAPRGARSPSPTRSSISRKRSLHLSLVLVSAAALSACGNLESGKNLSRDAYASLEACKADWGAAGDCEAAKPGTTSTSRGTTHGFYGPRYYSRSGSAGFNSASRPGSRSVGTISGSSSRGGFGSSGASHSSSSSSSGGSHSAGG